MRYAVFCHCIFSHLLSGTFFKSKSSEISYFINTSTSKAALCIYSFTWTCWFWIRRIKGKSRCSCHKKLPCPYFSPTELCSLEKRFFSVHGAVQMPQRRSQTTVGNLFNYSNLTENYTVCSKEEKLQFCIQVACSSKVISHITSELDVLLFCYGRQWLWLLFVSFY